VSDFIASGRAIDVMLVVLLIELVWLVVRGREPMSVALALLPGALIVIALRGAVTGADWWWIAAPLAASLPVHLADLRRRGWL
jgi:hypothetical protein